MLSVNVVRFRQYLLHWANCPCCQQNDFNIWDVPVYMTHGVLIAATCNLCGLVSFFDTRNMGIKECLQDGTIGTNAAA